MDKYQIMKKYFGYTHFREGQEDVINYILSGKDAVGIMPTGAGKSMCFQLPAMMLPGITLVISPLISLMKDQVQALIASGIPAAFMNSSLSFTQMTLALNHARNGKYKIIYVAPERLELEEFISFAKDANISMVTIDEAHCISQWGQNFRPSYLKISAFIDQLPVRPIISAFTATATTDVKHDMIRLLRLHQPLVVVTGFDRQNLYFDVQKPRNKDAYLKNYIHRKQNSSGIVYCSTRKSVEDVCAMLLMDGIDATRYHAGLSDEERSRNQDDFLYDRKQVMVATNAFGMGIDKSNVSFVIHYHMPKSIEHYYQEAGRAGRDGSESECLVLYGDQDVVLNRLLIDKQSEWEEMDAAMLEIVKGKDRERLQKMTYYCHTTGCLRAYILRYFGETVYGDCGKCSTCESTYHELDITIHAQIILSCIVRLQERYGISMILDTLRGSKSAKMKQTGCDRISTYGVMSDLKSAYIKEVIHNLILKGYILVTDSEYPILKLGIQAKDILYNKKTETMKTSFNSSSILTANKEKIATKQTRKTKAMDNSGIDHELFEQLRKMRHEIALHKKVPAFHIFTDATLLDMAAKKPANEAEFLNVSGVGEVKLASFGLRFLEVIAAHQKGLPSTKQPIRNSELSFSELCDVIQRDFVIHPQPVTISIICDRINYALLIHRFNSITPKAINDFLIKQGILKTEDKDGKKNRIPTDKGNEIGIQAVEKKSKQGESYIQNQFDVQAQQYVIDQIKEILAKIYKLPEDDAIRDEAIRDEAIRNRDSGGNSMEYEEKTIASTDICRLVRSEIFLSEEPVAISKIVDMVNEILLKYNHKAISVKRISDVLVKEGYLISESIQDGKSRKIATEKGNAFGIQSVSRINPSNGPYLQNMYSIGAQLHIMDMLESILSA